MAGIKFDITGDNKNFLNSLNGAQRGVANAVGFIERAGRGIEGTFTRIKDSALGGFSDIAKGMMGLTALIQSGSFFKTLIDDATKFNAAMKEVSTLSEDVANDLQGYSNKVVEMTTEIPIKANDAAKALYQIESAGHHGADGLNVLRESAKGAIGGVTDTATTADAITTILNAYKMSASEAQHVSDLLFTTVRLGKTNMSQLGSTIAQVAPVAASFGVSIEDVLAAIASLTKQGTKTSVAVRQVRDAITATTKSMGDGAFQGRSFLDAMDEVAQKAQGSNNALRQDLGTLQALNAVLSLTGKNSQAARQDVAEMQNSAGAAEAAYEKMASTAGTQTTILRNNIFKAILPLASDMKSMSGEIARYMNEAFDSGAINTALTSLEAFIAAYAVYRGLLISTTALNNAALGGVYSAQIAELQTLIPLKELDGRADLQAAVAKGTLTKEQALLVASLRGEMEARYEEIMAAETSARAELKAATAAETAAQANMVAAEELVASAQARVAAAMESGSASEIEAAKEELNTAERLKNTAATELNTATRQKNGAATMVSVTSKNADTAATLMNTTQEGVNTGATRILTTAKLQLKKAIDAVNSSFLASPLFLIAATIAAVTYAVYKLVTAETAHEKAIRLANDAMDEQKKKMDDRKNAIGELIRTIQDPNATGYQKTKAYNELKMVASDITDAYSQEALAAMGAADAQKFLNESMDKVEYEGTKERIKELTDELANYDKNLQESIRNLDDGRGAPALVSAAERQKAVWEEELKLLQAELKEKENVRSQAADKARPIEIRIQEAQENVDAMNNIKKFYEEAMILVDYWQEANDSINFVTGQNRIDEFIQKTESELDDMKRQIENNPTDYKLQLEYEEKQKILNGVIEMKNQMQSSGVTTIPLFFKMDYQSFQNAWNTANQKLQSLIGQTPEGGAKSLLDDFTEAQSLYQKAVKKVADMEANRSKYTKEQYEAAKIDLKKAKDAYAELGGDTSSNKSKRSASSAKNEAERRVKEQAQQNAKQIEEELRYQEEIRKIRQEASDARRDAKIASIQNDGDRERAEQDEQHERNLRQIKEQANEMRKAIYEHNKKTWENSHKDSPYENTEAGKAGWMRLELSEDQQSTITALTKKENAEYQRLVEQRYESERQATLDFLKEYGSYEQRKLAISEEYEDKIRKATSPAERASLQVSMDEELKQLDADQLQTKIDWSGVFSDLEGHTEDYLAGLRDQLQTILDSGNLPVDDMAKIQEKINDINDAIKKQGGMFKYQSDLQREYNRRLKEAQDAQKRLMKAKEEETAASMDVFSVTQEIRNLMEEIGIESDTDIDDNLLQVIGEGNEGYSDMADLIQRLLVAEKKLADAREKSGKAATTAKAKENAANERLDQAVARHLGNINEWVQTYLSDLPALLDELGLGSASEKVSQGMSAMNNAAGAAADFASGNYVGAALKAVSAVKDFGRVLGIGGGNAAEINKQLDRLSDRNEILTKSIDRLADIMGDSAGNKAIAQYEKMMELQKELEANLLEQVKLQMSYHSSHHSFSSYWGGFSEQQLADFNRRNGTDWTGDLNDLTADLAAMLEADADMWQAIKDTGKGGYGSRVAEWISQLAEQAGKADEYTAKINENLTKTSFDNLRSSFLDTLMDMEADSAAFADNLTKIMTETLVNRFIMDDEFDEWLKAWHEQYAAIMKDETLTEEQRAAALAALRDEYNERGNAMKEEAKAIQDATGYTELMAEKAEDATKAFEDLGDTIKSSLLDASSTAEDFARQLNKTLVENLLNKFILNDEFNKWLEDWTDRYNEILNDGNLSQEESDALLTAMLDEAIGKREELVGQAEELRERLKTLEEEAEKDSTFSGLTDSWVSALMDMNKTAEDWAEDVGRMMAEKIMEEIVAVKIMQPVLDQLQEAFNSYDMATADMMDIVGDETIQGLLEKMKELFPDLQWIAENLLKSFGVTVEKETDSTFSDMTNSWVSALMDMNKTAEDWAQDVGRTMAQKIIEEMVAKTRLQPLLDTLQEAFDNALGREGAGIDDILSDSAVSAAFEAIQNAFPELQQLTQSILERLGITIEKENPFSGMRDSFVSSLMDMEADAESFGKEIGKTLIQQMIDKILEDQFQNQIDALGEQWQAALDSGDMDAIERLRQKLTKLRGEAADALRPLLDDLAALEEEVVDESSPFDNLRSSLLSNLMDMKSDIQNFGKDINQILTEAMIDKFVLGDRFDEQLEAWKNEYAKIMGDPELDAEERASQLKGLRQVIEAYSMQMKDEAAAIHDLMGTASYEDQTATMNMSDKATYEQMDQYLSTQMGIYIATEQGNAIRQQILATLQSMSGITSPNGDTVREIRGLISTGNEYLLDIKRSNRDILTQFGAKLDTITAKLTRLV